MRKYKVVTRLNRMKSDWLYDDDPLLPGLTVFEPDDSPQDTGLIDHRGQPIFAYEERQPIGFTNRLALNN